MRHSKECVATRVACCEPRGSLIWMIDYLIPEAKEIEPLAEYFLRMARTALLEANPGAPEQRSGD